jgi:hypothetical protein
LGGRFLERKGVANLCGVVSEERGVGSPGTVYREARALIESRGSAIRLEHPEKHTAVLLSASDADGFSEQLAANARRLLVRMYIQVGDFGGRGWGARDRAGRTEAGEAHDSRWPARDQSVDAWAREPPTPEIRTL